MREAVQIIRMTAAGERVNFDGRFYHLRNFRLGDPGSLAGAAHLSRGARAEDVRAGGRGRRRRAVHVDAAVGCGDVAAPRRDRGQARRPEPRRHRRRRLRADVRHRRAGPVREALAREITGYAIVNAYARFFAECGFAEEAHAVNAAWKAGDRAGAVKGISERLLDGLGAVGSAAAVPRADRRLRARRRDAGGVPLRRSRADGPSVDAADLPRVPVSRVDGSRCRRRSRSVSS